MPFDQPYIPDVNNILSAGVQGYKLGNAMRQQNAMAEAGKFLSQGDQTGAKNALYNAGEVESGLKLEDHFRQVARQADADKLAKAQRFNEKLGNLAMLADTPEKWQAAIGTAKQAGLDVDKWADFGTRDYVLAQAGKANEVLTLELNRRKIDEATAAKQAAAAAKLQPKPKSFNVNDANKLSEKGVQLENLKRYNDTFNDEYAGYGRGGEALMSATRTLPFIAGQQTEDAAKWWQDYARYKNVVRNQLFGSALTESEKAAFEEADISPNMSPDVVKDNLARQQSAVRSALQKTARALTASGYSQDAVEGALGTTLDELNTPDEAVVKRLKPNAPIKVKSADEARELIRSGKLRKGDSFIDENGQPRTVN
jgi:hypothetical protein